MKTIFEWLQEPSAKFFKFEKGRVERADSLSGPKSLARDAGKVSATIGNYNLVIILTRDVNETAQVEQLCTCEDFQQRFYVSDSCVQPCKHLIRLMKSVTVSELDPVSEFLAPVAKVPAAPEDVDTSETEDAMTFNERLINTIDEGITSLAKRVLDVLEAGRVPFLVGPTGCGKTSAVSKAALMLDARFYETAGADSWTDSDLVGVKMPNGDLMPGPIGAAMMHAQIMGESVLIFLDEFLRFSLRAQESMMRVLLPKNAEIAKAMGIDHDGPIRITSAPFWGETWAPADLCHIVLAANPWGNIPDSALLRRVEPVSVEFNPKVLDLFTGKARDAIQVSWKGVKDNSLPLPIEYSQLISAKSADDLSFLAGYMARVHVIDPTAEKSFATLLNISTPAL